jgi:uncharacterized cupin superfamily protein
VREPEMSPPQPAVNALAPDAEAKVGPLLGADRLDAMVVEVDPGEGSEPYHYVYGREEWLLVLAGTPTLRHPRGEEDLETGDLVCFPQGPAGARRLLNRGESVVRALFLSTTGLPANVCYPDAGHWLIHNELGDAVEVREADTPERSHPPPIGVGDESGSDGTRTRDLRRDRALRAPGFGSS